MGGRTASTAALIAVGKRERLVTSGNRTDIPRSYNRTSTLSYSCSYSNSKLKYRVIHKSLRDFRPLRYSSQDGHADGEHVNRGRDTPGFCPTLQVLDMLTSEGSWQTFLAHARQSRPMARPASSFRSAQEATLLEFHVPLTNCFGRRWFCAVHGPKPLLHRHNWLSFGKFQDTEHFLIHCARHFSSRLPPSGRTCKYAKAPSTKEKTLRDSLPIDMLLSALSFLVVAQSSSEVPEGLVNNPVII